MSHAVHLLTKFHNRQAQIAVIGLGYVGLPLAVSFAKAGYQVVGIDLDRRKVDAINQGESYIEDVPSQAVAELVLGRPERVLAGTDILVSAGRTEPVSGCESIGGNASVVMPPRSRATSTSRFCWNVMPFRFVYQHR